MPAPGEVVWVRCQAQLFDRFSSNEEAELKKCPGNNAIFLGMGEWVSEARPDLVPGSARMPEGSGYKYRCTTCEREFVTLMGAKF